jgi:geranylgeranyl diphosphate synthase type I
MSEQEIDKMHKIFRENGQKALGLAKNLVLEEAGKLHSKEAREALEYFINEYWHDVVTPALIVLSCKSVGGDPDKTIPVAVPVILVSGAVDIHDDIIDQSKTKYDRPTVFGKYGEAIAILTGDALLFKGLSLMQETMQSLPRAKSAEIGRILKTAFFELGDAEASEIGFKSNFDVAPEEYLSVMKKKAADVEGLFHIGAIVGGGSPKQIEALRLYGRTFGLLSTLRDDWIDTLDQEELMHRIFYENLPFPILYALQSKRARTNILRILQNRKELTTKDAEKICEIAEECGGFERVKKVITCLAKEAETELTQSKIANKDLHFLLAFVSNI